MSEFKIIEKSNPLALHALCSSMESAQRWISVNAVEYCSKGYFMDKTLTPDSFKIIPPAWYFDSANYERRVQSYEDQGMTRSDAQGIVDAEDMQ